MSSAQSMDSEYLKNIGGSNENRQERKSDLLDLPDLFEINDTANGKKNKKSRNEGGGLTDRGKEGASLA